MSRRSFATATLRQPSGAGRAADASQMRIGDLTLSEALDKLAASHDRSLLVKHGLTAEDDIAQRLDLIEDHLSDLVAAQDRHAANGAAAHDAAPHGDIVPHNDATMGALRAIGERLERISRNAEQVATHGAPGRAVEPAPSARPTTGTGQDRDLGAVIEQRFERLEERLAGVVDRLTAAQQDQVTRQDALSSDLENLSTAQSADMDRRFRQFTERLESQIDERRFAQGGPADDAMLPLADNVRAVADRLDGAIGGLKRSGVGAIRDLKADIATIQKRLDGVPYETASQFKAQLDTLRDAVSTGQVRDVDEARAMAEEIREAVERTLKAEVTHLREAVFDLTRKLDAADNPAASRFEADLDILAARLDRIEETHGTGIAGLRKDLLSLSERIDRALTIDYAPRFNAIDDTLGRIAARMEASGPGLGADALSPLAEQIADLGRQIETLDKGDGTPAVIDLSPIETRLGDLTARLDALSGPGDPAAITALHRQLAAITARLEDIAQATPAPDDAPAIRALEGQIEKLADSLDKTGGIGAHDLGQLERTIADLAERLGTAGGQIDRLGGLEGGMSALTERLDAMRQDIVDTATKAAEQAVAKALRTTGEGGGLDGTVAAALTADIAALREAGEAASKRTETALDTVSLTLSKIVNRLADLEDEVDGALSDRPEGTRADLVVDRTDAGDVSDDARDDIGNDAAAKPAGRGLFGFGRKAAETPPAAPPEAVEQSAAEAMDQFKSSIELLDAVDRDGPVFIDDDTTIPPPVEGVDDDTPLKPGSREPYTGRLSAKATGQVRTGDVAADAPATEADAKTDFLTAARRAAQAARQDADPDALTAIKGKTRKWGGDTDDDAPRLGLLQTIDKHRRKLLVGTAVVLLIIGGIRLAGMALDGTAPAETATPPAAEQTEPAARAAPSAPAEPAAPAVNEATETPAIPITDDAAVPGGGTTTSDSAVSGQSVSGALTGAVANDTAPADAIAAPIVNPPRSIDIPSAPADQATDGAAGAASGAAPPLTPVAAQAAPVATDADDLITHAIPDRAAPSADRVTPPLDIGQALDLSTLPEAIGPEGLRDAAEAGDAEAQFEVATRYMEGRGVAQDLPAAMAWYRAAATQGFAPAQHRLASMYERGRGIDRDPRMAELWYTRAAESGNRNAMHNLAVMNAQGAFGEPNYDTASRWFLAAAERGLRDSQFNMAILYARGLGVERDLAEAYKWLAIAAATGDGEAAKKRDEIAAQLDSATLATARAGVDSWRPQPLDESANVVTVAPDGWGDGAPAAPPRIDGPQMIAAAQFLLQKLGFDPGPPDGIVGPRTRQAVRAFESREGLPETGRITPDLIQRLSQAAG